MRVRERTTVEEGPSPPAVEPSGSRGWRHLPVCLPLFLLGLSLYLLTLPADLRNNADTIDRFFVTRALVDHRSLEVACGAPPHDKRLVLGRHNCYYAIYAPGQTLLMAPLYVAGKAIRDATGVSPDFTTAVAVRILDPILGALLLVMFYLVALEAGFSRRTGILLTLILGFASTAFPDVQSGQEHTQAGLALVASVYAALKGLRARGLALTGVGAQLRLSIPGMRSLRRGTTTAPVSLPSARLWLLLSGAAAGFGAFTRYDFVVETGVVVLFLAWCLWPDSGSVRQRIRETAPGVLWFAAGALPFALVDAAWNTLRFGAPWRLGQAASDQFGFPILQGVPNLLISPAKGLIWYLPLLWLLPFAVPKFYRRAPRLTILIAGLFVAAVIFYANVVYWHGDPAWGPRYLFPIVPVLLLPLGELLDRFGSFRLPARTALLSVVGLSLVLQVAAVGVDGWRFWHHLIEHREQAGQLFKWKPKTYNYYWTSDASLDPELYQFVAAKDVVQFVLGDKSNAIPDTPPPPLPGPAHLGHRRQDIRLADGVSTRPLNTVSPIWLNDRYAWINDPVTGNTFSVPLSTGSRVAIVSFLVVVALLSAATLQRGLWRTAESSPVQSPKLRRATSGSPDA